jgi:hypothetical protein
MRNYGQIEPILRKQSPNCSSFAADPATFGHHVCSVVGRRAQEEMVGAHTWRIVAVMAHEHSFWNRPIRKDPRPSVCAHLCALLGLIAIAGRYAVPILTTESRPLPAHGRITDDVHVLPEGAEFRRTPAPIPINALPTTELLIVRSLADEQRPACRTGALRETPMSTLARVVADKEASPAGSVLIPRVKPLAAAACAKPMLSIHHGADTSVVSRPRPLVTARGQRVRAL